MSIEPFDWNIVIVGRWNRAILTPGRIAEKIFGLDPTKGVFVDVPLDGLSPYRVKAPQQEIMIVTENNQLIIQLLKLDFETLEKGLNAGIRVLEWLPETPLSAAGFNIRFKTTEPIKELTELLGSPVDSKLGNIGYTQISKRTITRSVDYEKGLLNLTIAQDNEDFILLLNFHRGSNVNNDLKEWLHIPVSKIMETVQNLTKLLGLKVEEENNDSKS